MAGAWRDEHQDMAARTAAAVADLVGDGCIVASRAGSADPLRIVASAHRDADRRGPLAERMPAGAVLDSPWAAQAESKDVAFRLADRDAAAAYGPGVRALAIAPLRRRGAAAGVVIALRDSVDIPYSAADQQRIEMLAADGASMAAQPTDAARLLERSPAAVWATDSNGATIYANHAASELAQVPAALLTGRPLAEFLVDGVVTYPLAEPSGRADRRFARADGSEIWVSVAAEPLTDGRGNHCGTVSTMFALGQRKDVEVATRLKASGYEAAAQLAEAAFGGERFDVLAAEAVAIVADITGAEYASLGEIAPSGKHYVTRAVHGWPHAYVGSRRLMPESSPGRLCLDEDEPIVIADMERHPGLRLSGAAVSVNPRSVVCLKVGDKRAVLSAHSPRPHAFDGVETGFMRLITRALDARWEPAAMPRVALAVAAQR